MFITLYLGKVQIQYYGIYTEILEPFDSANI